ncbi:hypothetical protein AYO27_13290 [Rhizobium sp. GHKF11]|nr:hypothetical protein AYO27_13290 [Rhizobium sp. GHKF11]
MQKVLRPALLSLIFLMIIALIVVMGGVIGWDAGWIHLADDHAPRSAAIMSRRSFPWIKSRPYYSLYLTYHWNDNAG